MNIKKTHILKILSLGLILIWSFAVFAVPDVGETVLNQGTVDDDYYAAGGTVNLNADFAGDVVVSGGELFIGNQVNGDVMAAGGTIQLSGEVKDDVRVVGGDITIDAKIGDDLYVAGGSIRVMSGSVIEGKARLAGGDIHVAGAIKEGLYIAAGKIRISGTIEGDVELLGEDIQILEGALIKGNLLYKSPNEAKINPDAKIDGKVTYEKRTFDESYTSYGIFSSLTLIIASIVLYLLFPGFTMTSTTQILTNPWKTIGIGIALLFVTPIVAILFMMTVIGVWVGLSVMALYFVALLVGLIISYFFIGDWVAKLLQQDVTTKVRRLMFVAIAIIVLALIRLIPVIGGLLSFLLLLIGLGAGTIQLYSTYKNSRQ